MGSGEVVLEARNLRKYFPTGASKLLMRPTGTVQAVDDVSFALKAGSTLGIVGESGCGKSTLGRLLTRLVEPTSGEVLLQGKSLLAARGSDLLKMRRVVQMVF